MVGFCHVGNLLGNHDDDGNFDNDVVEEISNLLLMLTKVVESFPE